MLGGISEFWNQFGLLAHFAGAIAAVAAAVWLTGKRERFGPAGTSIVAGLFVTGCWCLCVAAWGDSALATNLAETLRNLIWLLVLYRLFASDGRHTSLAPIRPVVLVLACVEVLHLGAQFMFASMMLDEQAVRMAFDFTVLFRLLVIVGVLVLVHNLYAGASGQSRAAMRWPASGLAVLWTFDLNLYTIAYLGNGWPMEIAASRGLAAIALAGLIVIGASKDREALRIRPSRAVTFQTFSLLVIGIYLVAMVTIAQWLSYAGGDFAKLMALGFLTVASVLAIFVLPSKRLRGWLKVTLAKHFFQHRYDYRVEWLRFTRTIGNAGGEDTPLGQRVIQAVADIADSPAGLLLSPGEDGELTLAARWQWPEIEVPAAALSARCVSFFEKKGFIADLDDIRSGQAGQGEGNFVPDWLLGHPRAWALVPLIHYERLVGVVVLARPPLPRRFDWEDFDLLRIVGRQLATYLAEHASQEALIEASRFDDFNRRIAFVMHDIKNLASQLSLLARNAELHAEKPEFREDMLVTLRNSSDKLNTLLARLSRYGSGNVDVDDVSAAAVARTVVDRFQRHHPVTLAECQDCTILANRDSLEQVLVHLIQNGLDASEPGSCVFLSLTHDGLTARFEIVDSGCGMSPEFIRTRLFKPFVSTKPGGFGIGAFEARELVRAMRGRLDVESREGLGTRFIVHLPLKLAVGLIGHPVGEDKRKVS